MPKIKNYSKLNDTTWKHDKKPLRVTVSETPTSFERKNWEIMIYRTDKTQKKMAKQERRPGTGVNLVEQMYAETKEEAMDKARNWMRRNP